ncbi:UDP glucuronosyltransferase 5 family, polypeptide E1 [Pygocentrus nattereri]|uniref:UDP-glucuronosyltransferase n=1 Tax=Pygocentrus nattereri TaxID=42514 RepID=A0A3B4E8I1_PYGNA|nr:UDP glucuronosyltransferase 5 family, polypeptide E1 [Pygocentrus nattereri]XP_037391597.1 UDP glucuronosyltransferase 5 family, polypeptide E1 [Pygocentrus nattereri]
MLFRCPVLLLLASLLWTQVPLSSTGRILVYPVDGSHWLNMNIVLKELHQRGHELTVVRSSTSWYIPEKTAHYTSLTIAITHASHLENPEFMASFLKRNIDIRRGEGSILSFIALQQETINLLEEAHRASAEMVRIILEDKRLVKKLRDTNYELFLTDPGFGGGVVLGAYLGLPIVLNVRWITNGEGHFAIAPSPLSYIPTIGSEVTDKMTFKNKLKNLLHYGIGQYIDHITTRPLYQGVISEFIDPDASIYSLIQGADLWLMRVDFVFEFPRPTMPNVVYMGGFQCKASKPLPADLEKFVQSSGEHGVVVMSLGTFLGSLGPEISEIIASAFARLPQKVVWRNLGPKPSTAGNNTLILDWLPQNDLLGHPKTKAFITHGGTNGIYEAIYHGIPVLGIPLMFDQFDNMVRLQARGVAEVLEVTALDVDTLTQALKDILDEKKPYRKNMRRMSQLHHDTPLKPMDTAIFWLEYVMRHKGAAHLRTESYKLPWYKYHNVDVFALVLGIVMVLGLLFSMTCRVLINLLKRKVKVKQQ